MPETPHPDDFRLPTGAELRRIRLTLGLSQREAARRIDGIEYETIGRIESPDNFPVFRSVRTLVDGYRDLAADTGHDTTADAREVPAGE